MMSFAIAIMWGPELLGKNEVEVATGVVKVVVIAVDVATVADVAFEAVDGKVLADGHQAAEPAGFVDSLDTVHGEFVC